MASKLTGNGIWEQKIILPEHRAALEAYSKELRRKPRAEIDEQAKEEINRALQMSMRHKIPINVRLYDPYETLRAVGVVENVSRCHGQFRIGDDWFDIADIEDVEAEY